MKRNPEIQEEASDIFHPSTWRDFCSGSTAGPPHTMGTELCVCHWANRAFLDTQDKPRGKRRQLCWGGTWQLPSILRGKKNSQSRSTVQKNQIGRGLSSLSLRGWQYGHRGGSAPGDSFLLPQHMLDLYAGSRADPFLLPPKICFT